MPDWACWGPGSCGLPVPSSLPDEGKLPRRVALFQSFHLPVLHHELKNVVSELRSSELQTFERDERVGRLARKCQRKAGTRLIEHLKLNLARGHVSARQLFQKAGLESRRFARENHLSLIQRADHAINVSLWIGPEVDRKPAVLLVI